MVFHVNLYKKSVPNEALATCQLLTCSQNLTKGDYSKQTNQKGGNSPAPVLESNTLVLWCFEE